METISSRPLTVRIKSSNSGFQFSSPSSSVDGNSNRSPRKKKTCLCSPTTHPGSFRCSIHKRLNNNNINSIVSGIGYPRRSAVVNSLMRLGTVDGYLIKRAVASLIRPSSHQQRRRSGFQPGPTRLSVMSTAD